MNKAPKRRVHEMLNRILAIHNLLKAIRTRYPAEANQIQTELLLIQGELKALERVVTDLAASSSASHDHVV